MSMPTGYRRRPLSPHEIRNSRIRQIGFRKGYDPAEVEALLQRLAEEVAARDGKIAGLMTENELLHREVYARRHGQLPSSGMPVLDEELITQRAQAQQYADDMLAAAQSSAAQLVSQSRQQANEILRAAHNAAERAVREYRANAGGSYTADRGELTRLATLAHWAMRQLAGLRAQVDATDDAARLELSSIVDRLAPMLANPGQQPAPQSVPPQAPPPTQQAPQQPDWLRPSVQQAQQSDWPQPDRPQSPPPGAS
jgi:DivIVA domain-containing protein